MKPEARVEGCAESLPGVCMNDRAHYSIPRFWDKTMLGRPLTDATIARYMRQGRYGRCRLRLQETRFGLVYSA
jgi:hypothetical protein